MVCDGFLRDLLPGNEDTESLEGMGEGITLPNGKKILIGFPCRRSSVGRKGVFKLYSGIPVGAKFRLGSSECLLCSKCSVELHGSLFDCAGCSIRVERKGGQ